MQAEKGEKRAEVQKVKLNRRNLNQHKGGREKMSNGEHEIRTPKGLRIGNRSVVDGKICFRSSVVAVKIIFLLNLWWRAFTAFP